MSKFAFSFEEMEAGFGPTHWTWRRLAKDKRIRTIKIGSRVLIPMEEVERIKRDGVPRREKNCAAGK